MYLDARDELIRSQQIKFLLSGGLSFIGLLILLYLMLYFFIIKPVDSLVRVTQGVAEGDFIQKIEIKVPG